MINVTAKMDVSNATYNADMHLFKYEGDSGEFTKRVSKSNNKEDYMLKYGSNNISWDERGKFNAGSSNYRSGDRNRIVNLLSELKSKFGVSIPVI